MTVTVSQVNPEKLRLYDLSGIYSMEPTTVVDDDEPIRWSCERFWYMQLMDFCLFRRYTEVEIEIEEFEDE